MLQLPELLFAIGLLLTVESMMPTLHPQSVAQMANLFNAVNNAQVRTVALIIGVTGMSLLFLDSLTVGNSLLLKAFALVLIVEALLPLTLPQFWKRLLSFAANLKPQHLRWFAGVPGLCCGLGLMIGNYN